MRYRDIINNYKAIEYSKYKDITSYEKLMLYVARELRKSGVPLTFNYLCVATFKFFPDVFCIDEEFKEFPSVDRLNRTLMHLKYVKKGKPFLTGSTKEGYELTALGNSLAEEVEAVINNTKIDKTVKVKAVDAHKKGYSKEYLTFIEGKGYKEYLKSKIIDLMYIWEFYNVTPYTRIKNIIENLKDVRAYAKEEQNDDCINYVDNIIEKLK